MSTSVTGAASLHPCSCTNLLRMIHGHSSHKATQLTPTWRCWDGDDKDVKDDEGCEDTTCEKGGGGGGSCCCCWGGTGGGGGGECCCCWTGARGAGRFGLGLLEPTARFYQPGMQQQAKRHDVKHPTHMRHIHGTIHQALSLALPLEAQPKPCCVSNFHHDHKTS